MKQNRKIFYYAAYDISKNSIRSKIIVILRKYGMDRVQKSLFCGFLNSQSIKDLKDEIKINIEMGDSLYLIPTSKKLMEKVVIIGKGFDKDYIFERKTGDII